jgi:hypothetical protein
MSNKVRGYFRQENTFIYRTMKYKGYVFRHFLKVNRRANIKYTQGKLSHSNVLWRVRKFET